MNTPNKCKYCGSPDFGYMHKYGLVDGSCTEVPCCKKCIPKFYLEEDSER